MKTLLTLAVLMISYLAFAQKQDQLTFDRVVPTQENQYVAVPADDKKELMHFGFIYFDQKNGFAFRKMGNLKAVNGKLELTRVEEKVQLIDNLGLKSAKVPVEVLKTFGITSNPDWLAQYKSNAPMQEQYLARASQMNAVGYHKMALPVLKKLYDEQYRTPHLYYELTFAHNAVNDFKNAESVAKSAIQDKKNNDFLRKELIYAVVNQGRIKEADDLLQTYIPQFENQLSKAEAVFNMIRFSIQHKDKSTAARWLDFYKKSVNNEQFNKYIPQLEKALNEL